MVRSIAVTLVVVGAARIASAEGEASPMIGGAIVATHGADHDVAGVGAELVFWYGWLGLGAEATRQWSYLEDGSAGPHVVTIAGSLRVLAFDVIVPSVLDSREVVDLGLELHGVIERAWWDRDDRDPISYGFGAALRLRGVDDDDHTRLLTESRIFVRAMYTRTSKSDFVARDTMPAQAADGVGVIIGLGAQWGAGQSTYVARLRRNNSLDSEWLVH